MKKIQIILCSLVMLLVFTGCAKTKTATPELPLVNEISAISSEINAAIYIDGTLSMAGYVNYPGSTIYSDALQDIERTIKSVWKDENIKYFKFGNNSIELSRKEFTMLNQVDFYDGINTNLDNLIKELPEDNLNIVVTDLFQTDQDLDNLIGILKAKYLIKNNGIGIIGLKSQFNGKIYDVGKNSSSIEYSTTNDKDSYRPFYIIVLGKEADVKAFMKEFASKIDKSRDLNMVYVGKNIGTAKLDNENVKKEKNTARMAELDRKNKDNSGISYRLKLDEKKSIANIDAEVNDYVGSVPSAYRFITSSIMLYPNQKGEGIIDKVKSKISGKKKMSESVEEAEKANNDFVEGDILEVDTDKNELSINFTIKVVPNNLNKKQEGVYLVDFSLVPTKESYLESIKVFNN